MGNDYKQSMNLPADRFPHAGRTCRHREPKRLEKWAAKRTSTAHVLEKNKDGKPFVLHDGPPYANGPIHIGHAFNKILKDFVIKSRTPSAATSPRTFLVGTATASPSSMMVEETLGHRENARDCLRRRCAVCAASGQKSSSTCSATTSSAWA